MVHVQAMAPDEQENPVIVLRFPPLSSEDRRVMAWHEELHRRMHYGYETIGTAPGLECWSHRDPGAYCG
jgi:hypothetical protein